MEVYYIPRLLRNMPEISPGKDLPQEMITTENEVMYDEYLGIRNEGDYRGQTFVYRIPHSTNLSKDLKDHIKEIGEIEDADVIYQVYSTVRIVRKMTGKELKQSALKTGA